jgi:hypothetical protein|tara:strand:- start:1514 stop:1720 length:207 start_codon:yes stop_codon:yes gene_type:complete
MKITDRQMGDGLPSTERMMEDLADREAVNMSHSELTDILIHGVDPLSEMPEIEILEQWVKIFGDSNND